MFYFFIFLEVFVSFANNAEASVLDNTLKRSEKDLYSDEIRENLRFESNRYQCWKSIHCKHDKVSVCGSDAITNIKSLQVKMFDDECSMHLYNCKNGTMFEVSLSNIICTEKEQKPDVEATPVRKNGARLFKLEPRVQVVRGQRNRYFI